MENVNSNPNISVVLPIYNEQGNIEPLVQEIIQILESCEVSFEILGVDDGSTDGSVETLLNLAKKESRVVVLQHSRNFGQSAAMATGFRYAHGDIIITLDADGQNNPADIPRMLDVFRQGNYDCVCGIRKKRNDNWLRRVSSKVANRVRNWLTGDTITDAGCTFRIIRKESLIEIPIFNGMHRFIPTLLRLKGKYVYEIAIDHRPRTWGQTKYGVRNRAWRGLRDCFGLRWWKSRCFPQNRIHPNTKD